MCVRGTARLFFNSLVSLSKWFWSFKYTIYTSGKLTWPHLEAAFKSLMAEMVKNLPAMQEIWAWSLDREDPLEEEITTRSSICAWKIPWTEELSGLQSTGLQRVRQDRETNISLSLSFPFFTTGWQGLVSAAILKTVPCFSHEDRWDHLIPFPQDDLLAQAILSWSVGI